MSSKPIKIVSKFVEAELQHVEWEIQDFRLFMEKESIKITQTFDFGARPFKLILVKTDDEFLIYVKCNEEQPDSECLTNLTVDLKYSNQTEPWDQLKFELTNVEFDEEDETWNTENSFKAPKVCDVGVSLQLILKFEQITHTAVFDYGESSDIYNEDLSQKRSITEESTSNNDPSEDPAVPTQYSSNESNDDQFWIISEESLESVDSSVDEKVESVYCFEVNKGEKSVEIDDSELETAQDEEREIESYKSSGSSGMKTPESEDDLVEYQKIDRHEEEISITLGCARATRYGIPHSLKKLIVSAKLDNLNIDYDQMTQEYADLMEKQKFYEAIQLRQKMHSTLKKINAEKLIQNSLMTIDSEANSMIRCSHLINHGSENLKREKPEEKKEYPCTDMEEID